jgi:predicted RNA-binding Zn ribbon-like protein
MNTHEYIKKGFGQATLWIDFVNSFEGDGLGSSADHLRDPTWRNNFLHHWKLADSSRQPVPLKSLLRLRTLLRRGAEKLASPEPLRRAELRSLNTAMSVFVRPQLFQRQNGFVLEEVPGRRDWRWIQCQIAASFAKTLTSDPLARVKICPDPLCQWVFYDKTKGTTRLWCNERTCGNRNRVRRARAASKSEN